MLKRKKFELVTCGRISQGIRDQSLQRAVVTGYCGPVGGKLMLLLACCVCSCLH